MRTAASIGKTPTGWKLLSDPDVPADKQRAIAYDTNAWPKDVTVLGLLISDRPPKYFFKDKAAAATVQVEAAEKRAAEKLALSQKRDSEIVANEAKAKEAKTKAEAAIRAEEVKAKEASRKPITEPKTTGK